MKINDNARKVLSVLAYEGHYGFGYYSFAAISAETGLDRKLIRRTCRYLCRKGLVQYGRGLRTEDGEPAGSGYAATRAGTELVKTYERGASVEQRLRAS